MSGHKTFEGSDYLPYTPDKAYQYVEKYDEVEQPDGTTEKTVRHYHVDCDRGQDTYVSNSYDQDPGIIHRLSRHQRFPKTAARYYPVSYAHGYVECMVEAEDELTIIHANTITFGSNSAGERYSEFPRAKVMVRVSIPRSDFIEFFEMVE